MIGKVSSTKSFSQTYRYAHRAQKDTKATVIGGTLGRIGTDASTLSAEQLEAYHSEAEEIFAIQNTVSLRKLDRPVAHWIVGYPLGETPSDQAARQHAESYIAGMILLGENPKLKENPEQFKQARDDFQNNRLGNFQYSVIRHHDKQHDHLHIVLGRTDLSTGKAINQAYIKRRSLTVCNELEKEFELTQVDRSHPTPEEKHQYQNNGKIVAPLLYKHWKQQGFSTDYKKEDKMLDFRAYPATGNQPARLSIYRKGEKKPALSVYQEPQTQKDGTTKMFHTRKLTEDEAIKWRDRLLELRKERKEKIRQMMAIAAAIQEIKQVENAPYPEGYRWHKGEDKTFILLCGDREVIKAHNKKWTPLDITQTDVEAYQQHAQTVINPSAEEKAPVNSLANEKLQRIMAIRRQIKEAGKDPTPKNYRWEKEEKSHILFYGDRQVIRAEQNQWTPLDVKDEDVEAHQQHLAQIIPPSAKQSEELTEQSPAIPSPHKKLESTAKPTKSTKKQHKTKSNKGKKKGKGSLDER